MPDVSEPLDPYIALDAIRTFAKVALENEEPTLRAYEMVMQQILQAVDRALPGKPRAKRSIPSKD